MTIKQKIAIKKIVENGGNVAQAMRDAKYKEGSINNPGSLTKSKAFKELLGQYLPDDKLLQKHTEALEATKWNDFTGEREEDHIVRLKAVDLGYKLKHYIGDKDNKQGESVTLIFNIHDERRLLAINEPSGETGDSPQDTSLTPM
jgi:hypothetical protein